MDLLTDLQVALPEALLAAYGLAAVLFSAVAGDRVTGLVRYLTVAALAAAAAVCFSRLGSEAALAFNGLYKSTPFTTFAKGAAYALGAAALFMSGGALRGAKLDRYEYPLLLLFAALGAGLMLSANDLMTVYVGLETLSLASYVLAAFQRDSVRSAEAGLKYFVLGALSSGLLLYGASLIYGFAGSTRFEVIAQAAPSVGLIFGLVLLIMGFAFKASAAPLHIWTPDVYEGAPSMVVAFFATAPKIAAVALFAYVLFTTFGAHEASWHTIVSIIAAASMLVGAFGALVQNNVKRILAYSSISNVGFALIGVAAGAEIGAGPVLTYMTLYVIATLGLFGGLLALRRGGVMLETVSDLNGLGQAKPGVALGLVVLLFSVAGIPPAAGFWGKWEVFRAGLDADLLWLVLVGVVSSVVSLGYYLRLVWAIMMRPPGEAMDRTDWTVGLTVFASSVLVFPVLTIGIQTLLDAAARASLS
jgi:NADH-quinone oxidoreductase subunit N